MEDKIYTTILGDTWDSIAYKLYGNSRAYNSLFELNTNYIGTIIFEAGVNIRYKENEVIQENLAPWR